VRVLGRPGVCAGTAVDLVPLAEAAIFGPSRRRFVPQKERPQSFLEKPMYARPKTAQAIGVDMIYYRRREGTKPYGTVRRKSRHHFFTRPRPKADQSNESKSSTRYCFHSSGYVS
jgi:hypothetical protein